MPSVDVFAAKALNATLKTRQLICKYTLNSLASKLIVYKLNAL
jgi:hypothetical protein